MTADVEIRGVSHQFGTFTALDGVDLTIGAGKFAVLLGPSGCGKTTLLSILGGFLRPSVGTVYIGGQDVTDVAPAKRPSTTMFQDYALFPHMSLGNNVGFGLRMRGVARRQRDQKARDMLALVGLADAFDKRPHELSGGQKQRVALARALAVDPDLLLLDEPLGALDLKLRRQMQDELKAIQRRVGTTFVHVTHDQEEAMAVADEIIVMNHGRIQDFGAPEAIYLRPNNRFSAAFMGEANFISGMLESIGDTACAVETEFGLLEMPCAVLSGRSLRSGDPVELCFRPEHLHPKDSLADGIDLGQATIKDTAFFGTHHRSHIVLQRQKEITFTAHLSPTLKLVPGQVVEMTVSPSEIIVLSRNDGRQT